VSGEARTRGLIDTNLVIQLAAIDPGQLPEEMVISAVTLAELSAGPHHADTPTERAKRINILQHVERVFDPLPFDANAGRRFGMVTSLVLGAGRKTRIRIADLMIASVAIDNGLPLYTTNPDDYVGVESVLRVVAVTL
jgi:predicted nucleic acid-binding protein